MDKEFCALVRDLMPLYQEGGISELSQKIIENHLKYCHACRQFKDETSKNVFEQLQVEELEPSKEKKFLLKAKKVVTSLAVILSITLITSTVFSYQVGKKIGVYGERFRVAEEKDLFITLNQKAEVNEGEIILEKVLADNVVTSIILKTNVDMNYFDSITLKDESESFYPKIPFFFHAVPKQYQELKGYKVLNFKPIAKNEKKVTLEFIKWEPEQKIAFDIDITQDKHMESLNQYTNLLETQISDIVLNVEKFTNGISQSELLLHFDRKNSGFDDISFRWSYQDTATSDDKIMLTDTSTGENIPILSMEDITYLQDVGKDNFTKPEHRKFKIVSNPIGEKSRSFTLHLKELYAYYHMNNEELTVDFDDSDDVNINRDFAVEDKVVKIKSAVMENNRVKLSYEVSDQQGNILDDYLLDARIRPESDRHAVPTQGINDTGETGNVVILDTNGEKQLAINLVKLGLKLQAGPYNLQLKTANE